MAAPRILLKIFSILTAGALAGCITGEGNAAWRLDVPALTESEDGTRHSWAFWTPYDGYEGVLFQVIPGPEGNVDGTFPSDVDLSSCTVGMSGKLKIKSGDLTFTVNPTVDTGWVIPGQESFPCEDDDGSGCPMLFVAVDTEEISGGTKDVTGLTAKVSCPLPD